jgi:SpoVK/Ycf46/Vps4 family AAA+-type ATPase
VLLQQRLQQAGLYLARCEAFFDKDGAALPETHLALRNLTRGCAPIFLAFGSSGGHLSRAHGTSWQELFPRTRVIALDIPDPDYATRLRLWSDAVAQTGLRPASEDLEAIADRFVLTPHQIKAAAEAAAEAGALAEDAATRELVSAELFEAARAQSDQRLGRLAVKVKTVHSWDDLILPRETLRRIKEVAAAIKFRHVVYSDWGFDERIASGKGIKVLFSGGAGTGKTMTAGVIARDLSLDLYKIDLSGVVSKYIGETEKNLDRIFRAAHASNAILFFDEADALFGKRSEVKDAHDRYANIEVAYLLQKIEEYEGAVILASNLSRNIDDAFSRRMHYVVEFPLPDERSRERLWRGMFPARAPLSRDVDFGFIARQFSISGGDIRNVVLDAAFLAAQDGQAITMRQIVIALARQMMKQGKVPAPTDFKQYHGLIEQSE